MTPYILQQSLTTSEEPAACPEDGSSRHFTTALHGVTSQTSVHNAHDMATPNHNYALSYDSVLSYPIEYVVRKLSINVTLSSTLKASLNNHKQIMLLVVFYGCYSKNSSNKHFDLKRMKSGTLSSDPAHLGTSVLHGPASGPYCSGRAIFYKK